MQVESRKEMKAPIEQDFQKRLPWQDPRVIRRYKIRKVVDKIVIGVAVLALVAVLYPLLDIVVMFLYQGAMAISIPRLTSLSLEDGLANSIVGSLLLVAISTAIAVPLGVFGGVYLAEFSDRSNFSRRYADVVRFVSDVLSGMPSILLGYVGYLVLVISFGWGFSPLAAGLILSVLMLPYVVKTTEISLRKVPLKLREAATGLGATKSQLVNRLSFPLAIPGILTGIVLSISIAVGETAPLLFTAGTSDYYPCGLTNCPVGYLTGIIFTYATAANSYTQSQAYLAVFLLISFALVLNVTARIGLRRISRI